MVRGWKAAVFAAGLALAGTAFADEAAIQGVISSQIEAFQADDFATAFTFASPMIKDIFRTPENFGRMVRQGYPMVWRPADVQFGELQERNGLLFQRVEVQDGAGSRFALEYQMIETAEGWQINGVQVLRLPGVGV